MREILGGLRWMKRKKDNGRTEHVEECEKFEQNSCCRINNVLGGIHKRSSK